MNILKSLHCIFWILKGRKEEGGISTGTGYDGIYICLGSLFPTIANVRKMKLLEV
jgi:hypothetical protein